VQDRLRWRIGAAVLLCTWGALALVLVLEGGARRIGGATLVAAVVAGAVGLFAAWRIARPIEEAAAEAARLAAGESRLRLPSAPIRELRVLCEALNDLSRQLEARHGDVARQRTEQDAILASMTEGVLAVDNGGRVLTLNPAAARIFGMTGVPYQGRALTDVVRNPDLLRFVDRIDREGGPAETQLTLGSGARARHLRVGGTRLADRGGRRLGTVVVLSDITRIRELENLRRDFVANVSHELKTPVTAIKGAADTLLEGAGDEPQARERFLAIIGRQSERLAALISDTLSLAHIEQQVDRGATARLREAAVREVLVAAEAACETQALGRAVRVEVDCPEDLSAPMDPPLVEQAVINLLQNAIQYSPKGAAVTLHGVAKAGECVIEVIDRGPGIGPEHLPRLFERFYRVDPARSRELGGTGLGLAIVKHICLAHGGRATVESTLGLGSTFRIHLPAA
jgi:two-component system phosphate regulon sensor histidine kinase PhoR